MASNPIEVSKIEAGKTRIEDV